MLNYRNEAAFSKVVCSHFRTAGFMVQRIESGITSKGIPDIFMCNKQHPVVWLELKRQHTTLKPTGFYNIIDWRPGQQAWMFDFFVNTGIVCYTIACFNDIIAVIPMNKIYINNRVDVSQGVFLCSNIRHLALPSCPRVSL